MKKCSWIPLVLLLEHPNSFAQEEKSASAPSVRLASVTILVKDYDKAAKCYSENLGFQVKDNKDTRPGQRWVTISSGRDPNFRIILHKPGNCYMALDKTLSNDRIGKETYWILQTSSFHAA